MTDTTKKLTAEEASELAVAVIGDVSAGRFSTGMPEGGDIALVLKAGGGVEILSVMDDNPTPETLASLGVRGMFALALFKIARDADFMATVIQNVSGELEGSPAIKLDS